MLQVLNDNKYFWMILGTCLNQLIRHRIDCMPIWIKT